ncbi:MAG: hypothetical protein HY235_08690 [Acidobacteria bacterium]|nr:hypothetical protein [Acidobacteriota bacterium]
MPTKLWPCPTCKRKFAKQNQWHSCQPVSIDAHFKGKPAEVRTLFEQLSAKLRSFGSFRMDAVKSSINLVSKHHFGGVRVLKDGLHVGFILSHPLNHPRILRTQRITPTIYGHRVKLTRAEDLDAELLSWLREAHSRST